MLLLMLGLSLLPACTYGYAVRTNKTDYKPDFHIIFGEVNNTLDVPPIVTFRCRANTNVRHLEALQLEYKTRGTWITRIFQRNYAKRRGLGKFYYKTTGTGTAYNESKGVGTVHQTTFQIITTFFPDECAESLYNWWGCYNRGSVLPRARLDEAINEEIKGSTWKRLLLNPVCILSSTDRTRTVHRFQQRANIVTVISYREPSTPGSSVTECNFPIEIHLLPNQLATNTVQIITPDILETRLPVSGVPVELTELQLSYVVVNATSCLATLRGNLTGFPQCDTPQTSFNDTPAPVYASFRLRLNGPDHDVVMDRNLTVIIFSASSPLGDVTLTAESRGNLDYEVRCTSTASILSRKAIISVFSTYFNLTYTPHNNSFHVFPQHGDLNVSDTSVLADGISFRLKLNAERLYCYVDEPETIKMAFQCLMARPNQTYTGYEMSLSDVTWIKFRRQEELPRRIYKFDGLDIDDNFTTIESLNQFTQSDESGVLVQEEHSDHRIECSYVCPSMNFSVISDVRNTRSIYHYDLLTNYAQLGYESEIEVVDNAECAPDHALYYRRTVTHTIQSGLFTGHFEGSCQSFCSGQDMKSDVTLNLRDQNVKACDKLEERGLHCNGGKCVNFGDDFYCDCEDPSAGVYCERRRFPCSVNRCLVGGRCVPVTGGWDYLCICPFPHFGRNCSKVIPYKEINYCLQFDVCYKVWWYGYCMGLPGVIFGYLLCWKLYSSFTKIAYNIAQRSLPYERQHNVFSGFIGHSAIVQLSSRDRGILFEEPVIGNELRIRMYQRKDGKLKVVGDEDYADGVMGRDLRRKTSNAEKAMKGKGGGKSTVKRQSQVPELVEAGSDLMDADLPIKTIPYGKRLRASRVIGSIMSEDLRDMNILFEPIPFADPNKKIFERCDYPPHMKLWDGIMWIFCRKDTGPKDSVMFNPERRPGGFYITPVHHPSAIRRLNDGYIDMDYVGYQSKPPASPYVSQLLAVNIANRKRKREENDPANNTKKEEGEPANKAKKEEESANETEREEEEED